MKSEDVRRFENIKQRFTDGRRRDDRNVGAGHPHSPASLAPAV